MMRKRSSLIISLVLACSLLAAGVTAAKTSQHPDLLASHADEMKQGSVSVHRLMSPTLELWTVASGGEYRILRPESTNASPPPSAEVGCCCTYLPCTLRRFP